MYDSMMAIANCNSGVKTMVMSLAGGLSSTSSCIFCVPKPAIIGQIGGPLILDYGHTWIFKPESMSPDPDTQSQNW